MQDKNQSATIAAIKADLRNGGPYHDSHNYRDPSTPAAFKQDMEGYFTYGRSGSNYADSFLGTYYEQWWAIPSGAGTATAYFRVTNTTDLNAFAHPEFFTRGAIKSIDGAQAQIASAFGLLPAPWAPSFSPQQETFQWQEPISY
jgi:hypothetical protein